MIAGTIAQELGTREEQVTAALSLLDAGNTVPFIARYRKEATGGLDDTQLRTIEARSRYLAELEERKQSILSAIAEQGKLTDTLRALIEGCSTKARLEDLYLPFKKRRRTKADAARDAGLDGLVDQLIAQPHAAPEDLARGFTCAAFPDEEAALDGARHVLVDRLATDADLVGELREEMYQRGALGAEPIAGKEHDGAKYRDYFEFHESFGSLPSHRILALLRGEKEGVLRLTFGGGEDAFYEELISRRAQLPVGDSPWLSRVVHRAWRTKLSVSSALDIRLRLKEAAEAAALEVFAANLRDVLLAAPAGQRAVLGLDPGYRNGVKCAVVDPTGKVLDTVVLYPHQPARRWEEAVQALSMRCAEYGVELIAVGNGTASRETEKLSCEVGELLEKAGGVRPKSVVVSESGASVYSASEAAAAEFPEMDVSLRGAVSIARRLQDPLAELVKIDPKAIGVGQYQHDVNQQALARTLDAVVEDAVNAVGVDLNTASVPLLERVAGVNATIAENIVAFRNEHGAFRRRKDLLAVSRLGPKAYEQCAGFLRIQGGEDPLDASAVHPESYSVVRAITARTGLDVGDLIGNKRALETLNPCDFVDAQHGLPTVKDILGELLKPGRDPRGEFTTASFAEGVEKLSDVKEGMILEGTVTNVAAFGAFVDVGVHQDGLVHVSRMARRFVKDPHEVVRSGDVVRVKVIEVDTQRQRMSLSLRLDDEAGQGSDDPRGSGGSVREPRGGRRKGGGNKDHRRQNPAKGRRGSGKTSGSLADALREAGWRS